LNRDQKAAVIDRVAGEIEAADAVFAVDYRGLSVKQAVDLRSALRDADARFSVVKNTLTLRAADQAGAEHLKPYLEGPTALTFVRGDAALAAKVIARFKREHGLLDWKGGQMQGQALSADELDSIARLPAREVLHGQLVGMIAMPLNGLVRGLASMISGLASQLEQIREQGLVQGAGSGEQGAGSGEQGAEAPAAAAEPEAESGEGETEAADEEAAAPEEAPAESDAEAPGDPVAEGEAAQEETSDSETPSEGEGTEEG
jgi:large subunit ribosomal protein L10